MIFKKSDNVSRWREFYDKYLSRRSVVLKDNTRLWVGVCQKKARVNIGINMRNPTAKEFNRIYRLVKTTLKKELSQ